MLQKRLFLYSGSVSAVGISDISLRAVDLHHVNVNMMRIMLTLMLCVSVNFMSINESTKTFLCSP